MDFQLNEEQRLLKESVDSWIADKYGFEQRKRFVTEPQGWSGANWRAFAELGLLALPFAEADGGIGGGSVESMIVMEAFGRGLVLEPYLATVVLAGGVIRAAANEALRHQLVPAIADGSLRISLAHGEQQSRYDLARVNTKARREANAWVLDGEKFYVLHGDSADKLVVSARVSDRPSDRRGIALFLVDADAPGVTRRGYLTQDGQRAASISFGKVRLGAASLIGEAGAALPVIEKVTDQGIAAIAAEAVGIMQHLLDSTVAYMKMRVQFGQLIGKFQALQHRAADMLVSLEMARSMAIYGTMMADEPNDVERRKALSATKVQINRSSRFIGQQAVQLHGGIAMTEEYDIAHYFRRLTLIESLFGDTEHHLGYLANAGSLIEA